MSEKTSFLLFSTINWKIHSRIEAFTKSFWFNRIHKCNWTVVRFKIRIYIFRKKNTFSHLICIKTGRTHLIAGSLWSLLNHRVWSNTSSKVLSKSIYINHLALKLVQIYATHGRASWVCQLRLAKLVAYMNNLIYWMTLQSLAQIIRCRLILFINLTFFAFGQFVVFLHSVLCTFVICFNLLSSREFPSFDFHMLLFQFHSESYWWKHRSQLHNFDHVITSYAYL